MEDSSKTREARDRAIRALWGALDNKGFYTLTNPDHVTTGMHGETWTIVYRADATDPDRVWDAFRAQQDPGPGRYREQVSDRLRSVAEVLALMNGGE
jgi:hypothetical protein